MLLPASVDDNVVTCHSAEHPCGASTLRGLIRLSFDERIKGDHHIFTREGVEEILNLQPKGSMAKPYQVKQVRNVIVRYKLGLENVE